MASEKGSSVTAKLVRHGVYQYVRLPKEFQFEGDEVEIDRHQEGLIIRLPIEGSTSKRPKKSKR